MYTYIACTVGDKINRILFGRNGHRTTKKWGGGVGGIVVSFNYVTILIFLVHRMPHSKKFKKKLSNNTFQFFVCRILEAELFG